MIPICLVTGFLGSGKTTLLKNLAARYRDRKLVYLVNDFARLDVDGTLMQEAGEAVVSIAGGSIFCKCLVTDFIGQLERIRSGRAAFGCPPEGVVIEASGMADPRVFQRMLKETRLDGHFRLASTITVVDPGRFLRLIHTLPNIRTQVEAADVVLVNKQDIYDSAAIRETETVIRDIAPGATTLRTKNGQYEGDIFEALSTHTADGDYAKCADPLYASFVIDRVGGEAKDFLQCLRLLKNDLYRVKGYVEMDDRVHFVEYAGDVCTAEPADHPDREERGLAFIVPADAAQQVRDRLAAHAAVVRKVI